MEGNTDNNKGCLATAGGCLLKIIGFMLFIVVLGYVRTCSKSSMRNMLQSEQRMNAAESKEDIDRKIYSTMDELRAQLPQQIDVFTKMKDVAIDDHYFFYILDYEDSDDHLSNADAATMKEAHQQLLKENIPQMRVLVETLIKTNRGLVYRYCGTSSGVCVDIKYSKEELSILLTLVR